MSINRSRAEKAIKSAEREYRNAVVSLQEKDYAGALKYFQECTEYAVKAVLIAYGMDYPRVHEVGRFLHEIKDKYPKWFLKQIQVIADVTDSLARGRPKFRYPYEYPAEEYEKIVKEIHAPVKKSLETCRKLIQQLFAST
ncbi:MAG: HEPN domain protein [Candidatus Bathyarchaeota archaeon BA2]|nr:MAG: HEPN domain protein [Candidatus Bathyarchaeota archaeon BA2]